MTLVSQRIEHLLNGVSQRPAVHRDPTQLTSQINAWSDSKRGLMKRPPTQHLAIVDADETGWDSAFVHPIDRDSNERDRLVIEQGALAVYDAVTGAARTVVDKTGGFGYLASPGTRGYAAISIGDNHIVVNRNKTVAKDVTTRSARQIREAFIVVRQADFSTRYQIKLGIGEATAKTVTFTTGDETTAQARAALNTDLIAQALKEAIEAHPTLNFFFTVTRLGSVLRIVNKHSQFLPFFVKADDGLGGQALKAIYGKVQQVEDLPFRALDGTIIEVERDVDTPEDNFWVVFDDDDAAGEYGVWKETLAPGMLSKFKADTMPHRLERNGTTIPIRRANDPKEAVADPAVSVIHDTEVERGWDRKLDDTVLQEDEDELVELHDDGVKVNDASFDNTEREILVNYDIDTTRLEWGIIARVSLLKVASGGGQTLLGYKDYRSGENLVNQEQCEYATLAATDSVGLKVEYFTGSTPVIPARRAVLNAPGDAGATDPKVPFIHPPARPVRIRKNSKIKVLFPSQNYPKGVEVTLEVSEFDGTNAETFTHETTDGQTHTAVATALQVLVNASANWTATNPAAGEIQIDSVGQTRPPRVGFRQAMDSLHFFRNDFSLVANEFAGKTLENLSDGSSGSIASNTDKVIVVSSLTGGKNNAIVPGDRIQIKESGTYYVFDEIDWSDRAAGDDETNPFPSFVGRKLNDLFFFKNRLGFLAGPQVVFSRSDDLFDLWRSSVSDLLDDDRIDVTEGLPQAINFESHVVWNQRLILWADNVQAEITGDPILSAKTVRLKAVSHYAALPGVRPVPAGRRLFFAAAETDNAQIMEYPPPNEDTPDFPDAIDISTDIPDFMPGKVLTMAADANLSILALANDQQRDRVYIYTWTQANRQDIASLLQLSWSYWQLPGGANVVDVSFLDGELGILWFDTNGVYLEKVTLGDVSVTPGANEQVFYLDRRLDENSTGVIVALNGADTDVTVPYSVNTDQSTNGELVVVRKDTNVLFKGAAVTRPSATQVKVLGVNLTGVDLWIGILYTMRVRLSPIYRRDQDNAPVTRGRTKLGSIDFHYHDTTEFKVEVTNPARAKRTRTLAQQAPGDGTFTVWVKGRAEKAIIEIVQDTAGGVRLGSLDWEGDHFQRSRRG